jgi:GDP-mannose 4,6-dehydratase
MLYENIYGYRSGINETMRQHLFEYHKEILSKIEIVIKETAVRETGSHEFTVLDIGSNDATFLNYYPPTIRRIGVDPTGLQFRSYYSNIDLLPTYFTYDNVINRFGNIKCKIISSISMFYDLPDPIQFAKDIYKLLDDDGIWTCEQSYLLTMLKNNSFDTICHEHLEYYSLHQIKYIADKSNFFISDVSFNDCNGGSFRIYFSKTYVHCPVLENILQQEKEYLTPTVYSDFMTRCKHEMEKLYNLVKTIKDQDKKVYIYGASTKGNCLLQYCNLDTSLIDYAVERNLEKIGRMTSTSIPIISEEQMRENKPDYLLVLPWHFMDGIIKRENQFLESGGKMIQPLPNLVIYSSKPKLLITGCDGMISHYVKKQFIDYDLYGITRKNDLKEKNITKFYFDLNDSNQLENVINTIQPDVIVHLASISSSNYAFNNPIETLQSNGMVTAYLCDIIHRNKLKTKLFNASSSEIYKGHINYTVKEDDTHKYHLHPYSIAKTMGHSIIDFYRITYDLPFSNGVIFTTQSSLKRKEFLLNKVAQHIIKYKQNKTVLHVGNLESYRCILHASDVANAIHIIIKQDKGDSYLICNNESHKIFDLVIKMYSNAGINLEQKDNILYDNENPVVIIDYDQIGFDSKPSDIRGELIKLKNLGWSVKISMNEILSEFMTNSI